MNIHQKPAVLLEHSFFSSDFPTPADSSWTSTMRWSSPALGRSAKLLRWRRIRMRWEMMWRRTRPGRCQGDRLQIQDIQMPKEACIFASPHAEHATTLQPCIVVIIMIIVIAMTLIFIFFGINVTICCFEMSPAFQIIRAS